MLAQRFRNSSLQMARIAAQSGTSPNIRVIRAIRGSSSPVLEAWGVAAVRNSTSSLPPAGNPAAIR